MLYLQVEKYVLADFRKFFSPQITKRFAPQIENPQSVTFAEGQQI
jgi:hypothetical protein